MTAINPSSLAALGRTALSEPEAKALLADFGVRSPSGGVAYDAPGLKALAAKLTGPFALKIVSRSGAHKSERGGVRLGVTADGLDAAFRAMPQAPDGYLIEEMAAPGVELLLGGYRHPRFGPVVLAGFGGVLAEVLDDIALRVCPITSADAADMLATLRGAALLGAFRGRPAVDRDLLMSALLAIGGADGLLLRHRDCIAEFDVNPAIATASGLIAVDARAVLQPLPADPGQAKPPPPDFGALLQPNAIAVAGASATTLAHGNQYIRQLQAYGFPGPIYPVHPKAAEIEGLPAFASLADLPEAVDYAYIAVGAEAAPGMLATAAGIARFVQVMASGFADPGARQALAAAAWSGGARLLGPNCLGVHSPLGRVSFMAGADPRPGGVAVLAQSGGLSLDILRRGRRRGICFRTVVTMGDAADLGPADMLPWLLDDPETTTIGLYLEDAPDGARLFRALQQARGRKPVVLLVGGRTAAGARAAASHTGALASDGRLWEGLARQTGAALVDSLDDFLAALAAIQTLRPRPGAPTRRVILFGNGGGAGVLAADAFQRAGLEIGPLPDAAATALAALNLPPGASAANPIDVPGNLLQRDDGRLGVAVVAAALAGGGWDAFVMHMNVPGLLAYEHVDILGPLIRAAQAAASGGGGHVAVVLRSDGDPAIEAKKQAFAAAARASGAAVFNELPEAAAALQALQAIERSAPVIPRS